VLQARIDDIARSPDRTGLELALASAHGRADVIDGCHACHGMSDDFRVAKIADHHLHARIFRERTYRLPYQHAYSLAFGPQCLDHSAAEKAGCTGHQRVGGFQRLQTRCKLLAAEPVRFRACRFEQLRDA
jgi:hypothetical protein